MIENMGQIQDRLGGLEQTQELLAGKVNEIETVKITDASTQLLSGPPAQGLKDYEKDLGLQPHQLKVAARKVIYLNNMKHLLNKSLKINKWILMVKTILPK